MHFQDHALMQLADPRLRSTLFNSNTLAHLLATSHPEFLRGMTPRLSNAPFVLSPRFEPHYELAPHTPDDARCDVLWQGHIEISEDRDIQAAPAPVSPFDDLSFTQDGLGTDGKPLEGARIIKPGTYPVNTAIFILGLQFSLLDFVHRAKRLQRHLDEGQGHAQSVTVLGVVPDTLFDSEEWHGAEKITGSRHARRIARQRNANRWLERERMALVFAHRD